MAVSEREPFEPALRIYNPLSLLFAVNLGTYPVEVVNGDSF